MRESLTIPVFDIPGGLVSSLYRDKLFSRYRFYYARLLAAEEVEVRNLVDAGDGTQRRARLLRDVLAADILHRILFQRLCREATLL